MQHLKILNSKEVKNIRKDLKTQFGMEEKLDYVFLMNNENKIYLTNRAIEEVELEKLRIDLIGMYFGKLGNDGLKLTIEGSQLIGPKSSKSIVSLDKQQFENWLKGEDIELEDKSKGIMLVKHKEDFVGCGILKEGKLLNQVPKSRRLVNINN